MCFQHGQGVQQQHRNCRSQLPPCALQPFLMPLALSIQMSDGRSAFMSRLYLCHVSSAAPAVREQVLHEVAQKHDMSVANVALKWVMQQGGGDVVFPIVGLRGINHIQDNCRVLQLQLDAADLAAIDAVLQRAEGPSGDIYSFERGA